MNPNPDVVAPNKRTCNRHDDCDQAEVDAKARWSKKNPSLPAHYFPGFIDFHCHNDECEECFGY